MFICLKRKYLNILYFYCQRKNKFADKLLDNIIQWKCFDNAEKFAKILNNTLFGIVKFNLKFIISIGQFYIRRNIAFSFVPSANRNEQADVFILITC